MKVDLKGRILSVEFDNDDQSDIFFRLGIRSLVKDNDVIVAKPYTTIDARTIEIADDEYDYMVGLGLIQALTNAIKGDSVL